MNMPTITKNNIPKGTLLSNKPVVLWIHDSGSIYSHDAVVNPDTFPNFRDGQLLRIHCPRNNTSIPQQQIPNQITQPQLQQQSKQQQQTQPQQEQADVGCHSGTHYSQTDQSPNSTEHNDTSNLKLDSVIVKGYAVDKENLSKQQQLQVSISKDIADRFNLRSRQEVYIELIEPSEISLDHVELAFKEQYLGRSDMWRLQQYLERTCVYSEKKILFAGTIKVTVKRLFVNNEQVASGYITKSTRMVFRSASAKFFLFIQMSKEMWEFDEDGELYFEKAVNNFLPHLFNRWKEEGANHVVSIVLFTRVYYETETDDPLIIQSSDGRYYKDFYKVVADWESTDDWMTVLGTLKQEQLTFQPNVLLKAEDGRTLVKGHISISAEGNVLEAINLALNPFDKHYVDRDLMRTGLSLILITPGVGKFWVNKKLLRLTNERMTENGIAMDLVCLSPMPLHVTPLMCYMDAPLVEESESTSTSSTFDKPVYRCGFSKMPFMGNSPDKSVSNANSNQKLGVIDPLYRDSNDAPTHAYYAVPHWLDCSFYHHEAGKFIRQDKFKTRCKMYEIQMMGIMEHDICDNTVPLLQRTNEEPAEEANLPTIKPKRSSSSLNDKIRVNDENRHSYYSNNNGEVYLSTSANYLRRSSVAAHMEMTKVNPTATDMYTKYDSHVFKFSSQPRFGRKGLLSSSSKSGKVGQSSRNSFDGIDRPEASTSPDISNARHKSISTWHGDQRRVHTMTPYSQHANIKGHFDHISSRKDERSALDPYKSSPTSNGREESNNQYRIIRRGTTHSVEGKHTSNTNYHTARSQDEEFTMSSSTIDPVPINTKFRTEANRKPSSQSPRQAGSLPSIHRQSENSNDLVRTSFGANRSSPSHNQQNRASPFSKYMLINPCDPSNNQELYTSHLRSWRHALPNPSVCESLEVHWKSLTTPACLPLTTDYFPSNEELVTSYNHYMYTVSASEDTNLYQAGDQNLSEHVKTKHLLIEMLSQRLAQGFQIIVDDTSNHIYYPKTTLSKRDSTYSILGRKLANGGLKDSNSASRKDMDVSKRLNSIPNTSNNGITTSNTTSNLQSDVDKKKWENMVWWLSMGHQVHQLTFDLSGENVEVRRFVKITQFDVSKIQYKCTIWPKHMPSYRPKNLTFSYPSLHYQWNYLDHLVAGYQDELTDNLRFWRARFIIIPHESLPSNTLFLNDNLDEEEKRIALFETWIQNIRKAKWLSPEEREEVQKKRKKEVGFFSDLGIKLTTMDPSEYVASDMGKTSLYTATPDTKLYGSFLSSINLGMGLTMDSKTKDIAIAIQDPREGVRISDRHWHHNVFEDAFIGSEFVDWLINQFEEITTREKAVKFGNSLMQRNPPLFHSVTKRHGFLDGYYYYSLNEEFVIADKKKFFKFGYRKTYGGNESGTNSTVSTPSKEKELVHNDSTSSLRQIPSTQSNFSLKTVNFPMSQSIILDVDPYKKSDRRETAILHYDVIHNPKNCYHFQLNWLGCTAQLVQELVQNWSRQAERCGLKLVEGSVDQAFEDSENNNPFQCPVPITMVVPPPSVDELVAATKRVNISAQFYEIALVRHFGFVLDVEADYRFDRAKSEGVELEYTYLKEVFKFDQYIHRLGVSFIQIRPDGKGFYWVNNRLYTNHTPALIANRRQPHLCHPDALRIKFQERCNDASWLTEFWETTKAHFLRDLRADSLGSTTWIPCEKTPTLVENERNMGHIVYNESHRGSFQSQFGTNSMSPASLLSKRDFISQSFSSSVNSTSIDTCLLAESIHALEK